MVPVSARSKLLPSAAALAVLAACPPRVPAIDYGPLGRATTPVELLERVAQAEKQVLGLQGDSTLTINSPQGNGSTGLFLAVQLPALLHIEQLNFFNQPESVLVSDGQRFGLYDAREAKYYVGPATPENIGRFVPIVLPPEELASLLLGQAPKLKFERAALAVDEALGVYVLTLERGAIVQTLHVDPKTARVLRSAVKGIDTYDLEFSDVKAFGAATLPMRAQLTAAKASTRVELKYRTIKVNEPPDLTLFDLSAPDGITVVEVDERGVPRQAAPDAGTPN